MAKTERLASPRRAVPVLVCATLMAALVASLPATAAKKGLTKNKALQLFPTKAEAQSLFLDQSEGDARYLNQTEGDTLYLDQMEGDGRYLQRGNIVISHNGQWSVNAGMDDGFVEDYFDETNIVADGAFDQAWAQLHLLGPVNLGLRTFGLRSVQICYDVVSMGGATDRIDATEIYAQDLDGLVAFSDPTDRTSTPGDCYTVSLPNPFVPTAIGSPLLLLRYDPDASGDFLAIGGITSTWVPTGAASARQVGEPVAEDAPGIGPA